MISNMELNIVIATLLGLVLLNEMIASVLLKVTTATLFECAQISGHVWSTGVLVL